MYTLMKAKIYGYMLHTWPSPLNNTKETCQSHLSQYIHVHYQQSHGCCHKTCVLFLTCIKLKTVVIYWCHTPISIGQELGQPHRHRPRNRFKKILYLLSFCIVPGLLCQVRYYVHIFVHFMKVNFICFTCVIYKMYIHSCVDHLKNCNYCSQSCIKNRFLPLKAVLGARETVVYIALWVGGMGATFLYFPSKKTWISKRCKSQYFIIITIISCHKV